MKKKNIKFMIMLIYFISSGITFGQWVSVLDDVTPVDIAISPDYIHDQTVYIMDDEKRILISETGGSVWVTLYEAADPSDPSQAVLDILLSPNFLNDDAIIMIHKDGTAELSADRGQEWFSLPVPDGTTGIVFSPKMIDDYTLYSVTGALGPVKFYKSPDGGANWNLINNLGLGGGFYCRLWNGSDTASIPHMAVLYDNSTLYITPDDGLTWENSFWAQVSVRDFVFSPGFSDDQTVFVADASEIFRNVNGGDALSWVSMGTFAGSFGIKFAISPGYPEDQTIFAAIDNVGIVRSTDGGISWSEFNDGFGSSLPLSIAISRSEPYTIFAGSMQTGGAPDKLWRYQTSSSTGHYGLPATQGFRSFPNPFSSETEIIFEMNSAGHVQLILYDLAGKKMSVLVDGDMEKGTHRVNLNCVEINLAPGVYFCRLTAAGDRREVIRLIVQR